MIQHVWIIFDLLDVTSPHFCLDHLHSPGSTHPSVGSTAAPHGVRAARNLPGGVHAAQRAVLAARQQALWDGRSIR